MVQTSLPEKAQVLRKDFIFNLGYMYLDKLIDISGQSVNLNYQLTLY